MDARSGLLIITKKKDVTLDPDHIAMMEEAVVFILNKYKGEDVKLLDKEVKFYGNSIMSNKYRTDTASVKYNSAEEYIKGKK